MSLPVYNQEVAPRKQRLLHTYPQYSYSIVKNKTKGEIHRPQFKLVTKKRLNAGCLDLCCICV